jgi:hypothetical protein
MNITITIANSPIIAAIIDGITMVPVRTVADAIGTNVRTLMRRINAMVEAGTVAPTTKAKHLCANGSYRTMILVDLAAIQQDDGAVRTTLTTRKPKVKTGKKEEKTTVSASAAPIAVSVPSIPASNPTDPWDCLDTPHTPPPQLNQDGPALLDRTLRSISLADAVFNWAF